MVDISISFYQSPSKLISLSGNVPLCCFSLKLISTSKSDSFFWKCFFVLLFSVLVQDSSASLCYLPLGQNYKSSLDGQSTFSQMMMKMILMLMRVMKLLFGPINLACVNCVNKILQQKCVNHEDLISFAAISHFKLENIICFYNVYR